MFFDRPRIVSAAGICFRVDRGELLRVLDVCCARAGIHVKFLLAPEVYVLLDRRIDTTMRSIHVPADFKVAFRADDDAAVYSWSGYAVMFSLTTGFGAADRVLLRMPPVTFCLP